MLRRIVFCIGLALYTVSVASAQTVPNYQLEIELDSIDNLLKIKQKIYFTNTAQEPLDTLYLNDWNHAFSSTETPLAKRLVEEYNRSFYLSNRSKRGETIIHNMHINGQAHQWFRLKDRPDIIALPLNLGLGLEPKPTTTVEIDYTLHLPDGKFTGYGIIDQSTYFLENFILTLGWRSKKGWNLISNLDLQDAPNNVGNFKINFKIPKPLVLYSNLPANQTDHTQFSNYEYRTDSQKELIFHIGKNLNYNLYQWDDKKVYSNLEEQNITRDQIVHSLKSIDHFLQDYLGDFPHQQFMLSQEKQNKRPFYGLTLVPSFLKPFPPKFEFEIKALNAYLYHYLSEVMPFHPREDYWLMGGLHSYLMMTFVQKNYPDKKVFGLVLQQPIARFLLNKYRFANIKFDESFIEYHEFILRRNLQQALFSSKEDLIRFNAQIGNPSQLGSVLNYIIEQNNASLKEFLALAQSKQYRGEELKNAFLSFFKIDQIGLKPYFSNRYSLDLLFEKLKIKNDQAIFSVKEKRNTAIPYTIGWIRNDTLIKTEKFDRFSLNKTQVRALDNSDYLVINPVVKLPEFNPRNNIKKLKGLRFKPIRLSFVKDLENTKYNQLFYNPRLNFNVYDGVALGVRFNNRTIKNRPFNFIVEPFYSSKEQSLIGSFSASFSSFNEASDYFLKNLNISGNSFHYDESLRYTFFRMSANLFKRSNDLRNNRSEFIRLFWQYVDREENSGNTTNPNYNVAGLTYAFSNKGALDYFTFKSRFEGADKFGKISLTADYRHLTRQGRQFSLRLFMGKFLWRNRLSSYYFDFSVNRPTDYLFQYNFLGRSETTGIYSQQFIAAEGGFKSKFESPYVDDFVLALNSSMGLWKWVEIYGDVGLIKRQSVSSEIIFDTGFRLNLLPDFFEFYFPVFNSNGFQFQDGSYANKIRFVLTLDPRTLSQLFSRKWF